MIFQSLMGLGKLKCDVPSGTTQGQDCPWMEQNKTKSIGGKKKIEPFFKNLTMCENWVLLFT